MNSSNTPVTLNFDCLFVSLNKLLNKQSSCRWSGVSLRSCDHGNGVLRINDLNLVFTSNAISRASIHWTIRRLTAKFLSLEALRYGLTHLPLGKMAASSQTIFSRAFQSEIKSFVLWSEFHWSLFLRVQMTRMAQAITWINADTVHWRIYEVLGLIKSGSVALKFDMRLHSNAAKAPKSFIAIRLCQDGIQSHGFETAQDCAGKHAHTPLSQCRLVPGGLVPVPESFHMAMLRQLGTGK